MKARVVFAAMLLMISIPSGSATVRISDDHGGRIGDYLAKYQALRLSGERVAIDGICASACTMILGALPRNRICVTPQATLQFHAAWDSTPGGNLAARAAGYCGRAILATCAIGSADMADWGCGQSICAGLNCRRCIQAVVESPWSRAPFGLL
jgi:hypothetical protein